MSPDPADDVPDDICDDVVILRRRLQTTRAALEQANRETETWRRAAVERWARSMSDTPTTSGGELGALRREVEQIHRSTSWRVTRPIRLAGAGARLLRKLR